MSVKSLTGKEFTVTAAANDELKPSVNNRTAIRLQNEMQEYLIGITLFLALVTTENAFCPLHGPAPCDWRGKKQTPISSWDTCSLDRQSVIEIEYSFEATTRIFAEFTPASSWSSSRLTAAWTGAFRAFSTRSIC
jgi:hypothetical protein